MTTVQPVNHHMSDDEPQTAAHYYVLSENLMIWRTAMWAQCIDVISDADTEILINVLHWNVLIMNYYSWISEGKWKLQQQ